MGVAGGQGLSAQHVQAAHRGRLGGETGQRVDITYQDISGADGAPPFGFAPLHTRITGGRLLPASARLPLQNVISTYSFFRQSDILSGLLQTQSSTRSEERR